MTNIIILADYRKVNRRDELVDKALKYAYESGNWLAVNYIEHAKEHAAVGDMVTFRRQLEMAQKLLLVNRV